MLLSRVRHYTKTGPETRAASRSGCRRRPLLRQLAASRGRPRAEPRVKMKVGSDPTRDPQRVRGYLRQAPVLRARRFVLTIR